MALTKLTDQQAFLRNMVNQPFTGEGSFEAWHRLYSVFHETLCEDVKRETKHQVSEKHQLMWLLSRMDGTPAVRVRHHLINASKYETVVEEFKKLYPPLDQSAVMAKLSSGQHRNEPVDSYIVRFMNLVADFKQLTGQDLPTTLQVGFFQRGLLPSLAEYVTRENKEAIDDNIKLARNAERASQLRQHHQGQQQAMVSWHGDSDIGFQQQQQRRRTTRGGRDGGGRRTRYAGGARDEDSKRPRSSHLACHFFWLKNNCTRGNRCRFSHRPICRAYYNTGECTKGASCRFAHLSSRFEVHPSLLARSGLRQRPRKNSSGQANPVVAFVDPQFQNGLGPTTSAESVRGTTSSSECSSVATSSMASLFMDRGDEDLAIPAIVEPATVTANSSNEADDEDYGVVAPDMDDVKSSSMYLSDRVQNGFTVTRVDNALSKFKAKEVAVVSTRRSRNGIHSLQVTLRNEKVWAMLDSGCTHNYICGDLVRRLRLKVFKQRNVSRQMDGSTLVYHEAVYLSMVVTGKEYPLLCFVTDKLPMQSGLLLGSAFRDLYVLAEFPRKQEIHLRVVQMGSSAPLPSAESDPMDDGFYMSDDNNLAPVIANDPDEVDSDKVKMDHTRTSEEEKFAKAIRSTFADLFDGDLTQGVVDVPPYEIHLVNPEKYRPSTPYRLNPRKAKIVEDIVNQLVRDGICYGSTSAYAAPIVLVEAPRKKPRLCIDYRRLNQVTRKDHHPLPHIMDLLDRLTGHRFYSRLDMKRGYWQLPMHKDSQPLTAFVTPWGQFSFRRLPFGLTNAPSYFQRMMRQVLKGVEGVEVYLDDIIIYGNTRAVHDRRVRQVMERLRHHNFKLGWTKCEFLRSSIEVLGHLVDASGIHPTKGKSKAIANWPDPTNVAELMSFLGFVGYYRCFIPNMAELAAPLHELTKRGVAWKWAREHQDAFNKLKTALVKTLAPPDFSQPFVLVTDASKLATGCVLAQIRRGKEVPIAFASKKLTPAEQNYSTQEQEMLSVIHAIKKFLHYIDGYRFIVVNDHLNLKYFLKQKKLSGRLQRWILFLQQFSFEIVHRKGVLNVAADALSRMKHESDAGQNGGGEGLASVLLDLIQQPLTAASVPSFSLPCGVTHETLGRHQKVDGLFQRHVVNAAGRFLVLDGVLVRKYANGSVVPVIPPSLVPTILYLTHDVRAHFGFRKSLAYLKSTCWWPKQRADLKTYIRSCHNCQLRKVPQDPSRNALLQLFDVQAPFEMIGIDFTGPFPVSPEGNRFVLVLIDFFTRYVQLVPTKDQRARSAARGFSSFCHRFGFPKTVLSDRGSAFVSELFRITVDRMGTTSLNTTAYHPACNGRTERINRIIQEALDPNINDFEAQVEAIQFAINTSVHKAHGKCPSDIVFRYPVRSQLTNNVLPIPATIDLDEIRAKIAKYEQTYARDFDSKQRDIQFEVGDFVLKRIFALNESTKKYSSKFVGPYVVTKRRENVYDIRSMSTDQKETINAARLKKYFPRSTTQFANNVAQVPVPPGPVPVVPPGLDNLPGDDSEDNEPSEEEEEQVQPPSGQRQGVRTRSGRVSRPPGQWWITT